MKRFLQVIAWTIIGTTDIAWLFAPVNHIAYSVGEILLPTVFCIVFLAAVCIGLVTVGKYVFAFLFADLRAQ